MMTLPDFLTETPHREILFTGHRICLHHVLGDHNRGMTPEQLNEWHPTLGAEVIRQVLEFYRDNRAEVDAYLNWEQEEIERQRSDIPRTDRDALRRRAEERKRAAKD
jgi:uncharacterized protein (DUF433 family)